MILFYPAKDVRQDEEDGDLHRCSDLHCHHRRLRYPPRRRHRHHHQHHHHQHQHRHRHQQQHHHHQHHHHHF